MTETSTPGLDRTVFSTKVLSVDFGDREYWISKTPEERLLAVELMRQSNTMGTIRIQRVLVVAQFV